VATFDPKTFLQDMARPRSLAELVAAGDLVDCTLMANWHGFQFPCFLTIGAWEAVIGPRGKVSAMLPPAEMRRQGERQHSLWRIAAQQMNRYAATAKGKRVPDAVPLHVPGVNSADLQRLEIRVATDSAGQLYVTVRLTGE